MLRKTPFLALAAMLAALLTSSQAQAWGAYHAGYTHVGPYGGVQHYGRTEAVGPTGAYGSAHYGSSGGYRYGASGGAYHYGGYHYGGYSAGGGYRYGYNRRW